MLDTMTRGLFVSHVKRSPELLDLIEEQVLLIQIERVQLKKKSGHL
jgi:hypothetical protein